jgi:hypothetical protein
MQHSISHRAGFLLVISKDKNMIKISTTVWLAIAQA